MTSYHKIGILLGVLLLGLTACTPKAPPGPTVPTPPQITLASSINVLAQNLDGATAGMEAAKNQGTMSGTDYATAMEVAKIVATTGKAINAELRTTDPWEVQKAKILNIITSSGLKAAYPRISPTAAALLAASVATFNAISSSVGGFQL